MDIRSFVNDRKIVLYGCGEQCEKFYIRFRDKISIQFMIDQNISGGGMNIQVYKFGIPIYKLQDISEFLYNKAIIVTTGWMNYLEIRNLLIGIGLIENLSFIYYGKLVNDRNIAYLYGNCHMGIIYKYFTNHLDFKRNYEAYYFNINSNANDILDGVSDCDLLITQDIKMDNSLGVPSTNELKNKIKGSCIFICIPNLYGCNLFFPQLNIKKKKMIESLGSVMYHALGELDVYILQCYLKKISMQDVENSIRNDEVFAQECILNMYQKEMRKLKLRERKCTIQISDYIEKNYHDKQLFYEPHHPTNEVICEKGNRILSILGFPSENIRLPDEGLDGQEIFLYGCVKKALDIHYNQKYINRNCTLNPKNMPIKLDEYIENCYNVFQLLENQGRIKELIE